MVGRFEDSVQDPDLSVFAPCSSEPGERPLVVASKQYNNGKCWFLRERAAADAMGEKGEGYGLQARESFCSKLWALTLLPFSAAASVDWLVEAPLSSSLMMLMELQVMMRQKKWRRGRWRSRMKGMMSRGGEEDDDEEAARPAGVTEQESAHSCCSERRGSAVQKNPAVFTGPLSVAAPPALLPSRGSSPSERRSTRISPCVLRVSRTAPRLQRGTSDLTRPQQPPSQGGDRGKPSVKLRRSSSSDLPRAFQPNKQKPPQTQPNPQPQPLTSASQTTLQPVNERPAGDNPRPISGVQAGESRSEGRTGPEKHPDSELQNWVPTTEAALKKRKRGTVDFIDLSQLDFLEGGKNRVVQITCVNAGAQKIFFGSGTRLTVEHTRRL
ncbi:uncharacterized protein LOC112140654 [Oryzias melastigma]|uniref:uncharacterized protein LOC112140654 n=1 Tax=Oryzias melastigma TaxID=30732 RepID=UPI00168CD87B|nr:uncharacterized protein LOC112140654 [Oryzias melastigma]